MNAVFALGATTYEEVSAGGTGHVEAVQVAFDPEATDYDALLAAFWELHDPTSELRQGADAGEHYRCAAGGATPLSSAR